jgi:peptidoglycan/xylan/chitin deacetylase (PgdA/CDA1 family)
LALAGGALPSGLQVVLYHHVADAGHPLIDELGIRTPPQLFEAHVRQLLRSYEPVDLDQVLAGDLPRRALLITFDDGYRSVLEVAAPILAGLNLPSVFFVSAAFLSRESLPLDNLLCWLAHTEGNVRLEEAITGAAATGRDVGALLDVVATFSYTRRVQLVEELVDRFKVDVQTLRTESRLFLDPEDLRSLAAHGCEIGNHTRSHLFCRAIADTETADLELVTHRKLLEEGVGGRVRAFSYPYGQRADATPFVEQALADSGHEASFLVEARPNTRHRNGQAWNRVSLDGRPLSTVGVQLEVLPRLRAAKDALRSR